MINIQRGLQLVLVASLLCACESKAPPNQTMPVNTPSSEDNAASEEKISEQDAEHIARKFMQEYFRLTYGEIVEGGEVAAQDAWDYSVRFQDDHWIVIAEPGYPDGYRILDIDPYGEIREISGFHTSWVTPTELRGAPVEAARAFFDHQNERRGGD